MKRNLLLLLISLCVVIGGYFLYHQYENNQLVKEAQTKAEEFIYRNFEDIDSIHIDNHQFIPMSALSVSGYINNNPDLNVSIQYNLKADNLGDVTSVLKAKNFPPLKEECKSNFCQ